jgi:hypothetical protein
MRNRLVPRTEWFRFFRDFSRRHEDSPVTVTLVSPSLGSQVESAGLPLEGIVADRGGHGSISIHLGRLPGRRVEHEVSEPTQVWVELSDTGGEQAVDIESLDGTRTLLQIEQPPPPAATALLPP